jgi:hypothetical protein
LIREEQIKQIKTELNEKGIKIKEIKPSDLADKKVKT